MKLLMCCQLFYPELISTGQSMTELAEEMVEQGMDVEVFCAQPTLQKQDACPKKMVYQGIVIRRLWSTRFPKLNSVGKALNHITFAVSVLWALIRDRSQRPVLVITNPPFLPIICALAGRKFVVKVADVYPDTLVSCEVVSATHPLVKLWHGLNRWMYGRARKIIVLGRCMAKRLESAVASEDVAKITHIPVWCDDRALSLPAKDPGYYRRKWGLGSKLVIGYSGNMGRFHDMETMLAVAEHFKDDPDLVFCFVGDGYKKALVKQRIQGLSNCQLHNYVPRERLNTLLRTFDCGVVSLLPSQDGLSVPSKTYGLLATSTPVIGVMSPHGEIAHMIRETDCGEVVSPGDVTAFCRVVESLKADRNAWQVRGENGRKALTDRYLIHSAALAYTRLFKTL